MENSAELYIFRVIDLSVESGINVSFFGLLILSLSSAKVELQEIWLRFGSVPAEGAVA